MSKNPVVLTPEEIEAKRLWWTQHHDPRNTRGWVEGLWTEDEKRQKLAIFEEYQKAVRFSDEMLAKVSAKINRSPASRTPTSSTPWYGWDGNDEFADEDHLGEAYR